MPTPRKLEPNERFEHDEITITHDDNILFRISKNGHVTFEKKINEKEYDEVTVPASVIFKAAQTLRISRRIVKI